MGRLDIHGCVDAVREHFYRADYLRLVYTLPVEAYSLNRKLQYRICDAWNRFKDRGASLSERECVILAEAWLIAAPDHAKPMFANASWQPPCSRCGQLKIAHLDHPENNPKNDPPDRWVCPDEDGKATEYLYEPTQYQEPMSGKHPKEAG